MVLETYARCGTFFLVATILYMLHILLHNNYTCGSMNSDAHTMREEKTQKKCRSLLHVLPTDRLFKRDWQKTAGILLVSLPRRNCGDNTNGIAQMNFILFGFK